MKRLTTARCVVAMLLLLPCCSAVSAQDKGVGGEKESSQSGLTGAGAGRSESTATKPGGVDGLGNPSLGGEHRPLYRLRPSDVLELTFTVAPEFSQTLTVQPDGYVTLRDADTVFAEGLTLAEFRGAVERAYRGYLHEPQAAVTLKDFEHPYFIVGGEVGRPGKYQLRSDMTVAEAVEVAGGFTSQAKHSQVILFRRVNEDLTEARLLNVKQMLKHSDLKEDAHLRPGDFVFVPQNSISKIAHFLTRPSMSMYVSSSQF